LVNAPDGLERATLGVPIYQLHRATPHPEVRRYLNRTWRQP